MIEPEHPWTISIDHIQYWNLKNKFAIWQVHYCNSDPTRRFYFSGAQNINSENQTNLTNKQR